MHKKIDILNIGLIVTSLVIAALLPFKLFLFSYAILGPLHYLTELTWLKDKKYFLQNNNKWSWVLIVLTVLVTIYPIFMLVDMSLKTSLAEMFEAVFAQQKLLILATFLFVIGLMFFKKRWQLLLVLVLSLLFSSTLFYFTPRGVFLIGLFLPTILHVYLFTGLFMLYGSKKSKSTYGYLGVGLLLLVPFIIALITVEPSTYYLSSEIGQIYEATTFSDLNWQIRDTLGGLTGEKLQIFTVGGIKVQIFIAFAYTYHYLNWFSKTSIIGWKKSLTGRKSLYIGAIWLASVAIYLYDYYTGLIALYFLSLLHVFLEFPLNVVTIKELFKFRKPN